MAQQTRSDRITSIEDLDRIVDSDAHLTEHLTDVVEYIDDRHSGIKKIIETSEHPFYDVFSKTRATPSHPFSDHSGDSVYTGSANTIDGKISEMDEYGIDYGVFTPSLFATVNTINNDRYAVALAEAYNDWLADNFHDTGNDRYRTALCIPPQKPDRAAEEIDRMADEKEVVGVQMPTSLVPPPGHEWYDPIYQAAEDNDLLIFMHGSGTSQWFSFPTQQQWNETAAEGHIIVHPFTHMWNIATMMFRAVPERFPDLNFIIQEAGVGWIGYWKWRMDDHYLERNYDIPGLNQLPSEYIDEQFYFTTQPLGHTAKNPEHIALAIETAGPENILWSSDLPHPDFDTPEELFNRIHQHFDEKTVRGIMGETAAELFGF